MTKFFIDQHGCAKNQTDGEFLAGYLIKNGFELTLNADEADFIIINSCGFIESAKKESIDAVYSVRASYPKAKIILAGCLAERYSKELFESMPELDGIFGNGNLSKIADFMRSVEKQRNVQTFEQDKVCCGERPVLFNFPGTAFVKITEGCSNHCSFCAIPLIRGEVRSRPVKEIVSEIKQLVDDGVYEINLIGQDLAAYEATEAAETNNYGDSAIDSSGETSLSSLALLLSEISKLKGDFIVRTLYIHPDHFNLDILPVFVRDRRFVPYFDIPFQSGDDRIIALMNRKGTAQKYKELIKSIREVLPEAVIRTTFLTGFPGETQEAALNTLSFLKEIRPAVSGCFAYSREENTPAWSFKGRVSAKTAQKRAEQLSEIQNEITQQELQKYIGKELCVLVEEIIQSDTARDDVTPDHTRQDHTSTDNLSDSDDGLALGRAWFQAPEVDGCVVIRYDTDDKEQVQAVKPGNVIRVKVLSAPGVDLDARFMELVKNNKKTERKFAI